jgi:hypothetical protein
MLQSNKRRVMTAVATAAVSLGVAGPASAQTQQTGLVNVNIEDNVVQVPVSVAANLCDINVAVLANLVDAGGAQCDATAESLASAGPSQGGGGPTTQTGLVNVNIEDNIVQIPVSVAANVCDVNVAVLAQVADTGDTACTATAQSLASPGRGNRGRKA